MKKTLLAMGAVLVLVSGCLFAACAPVVTEEQEKTYSVELTPDVSREDWFPSWMFFKTNSNVPMVQAGERWVLTLTIDLSDNTYSLVSEYSPFDEAVIEGDPSYHYAKTTANGALVSASDTEVQIAAADYVEYEIGYGVFMNDYIAPWSFSDGPDYSGKWNSDDLPEVADIVPNTTFEVNGEAIVDYVCEGIEDDDETDTPDEGPDVDVSEAFFKAVNPAGTIDLYFFADGTYLFDFSSVSVKESGTWVLDEEAETLTVTTAGGKVAASTPTETAGTVHIEYKSDKSDQLGGKFDIVLSDFIAAMPA